MLAEGECVAKFEAAVAQAIGAHMALSTGSGKAALAVALRAQGVGEGDQVLLPTYVCRDVLASLAVVGARPVFCDVGEGWVITSDEARARITSRTKALLAVHTFGMFADLESLAELGVPIIEDASQAFGPLRPAPSGTLTILSFQATKWLTTGEGGMVAARTASMSIRVSQDPLRACAKLSDLQAALGISQLRRFLKIVQRREAIAGRYLDALPLSWTSRIRRCGDIRPFRFPVVVRPGSVPFLIKLLEREGIAARRGVDALLHRTSGAGDEDFPNAVARYEETLSLPIYPALTYSEQSLIIDAIHRLHECEDPSPATAG